MIERKIRRNPYNNSWEHWVEPTSNAVGFWAPNIYNSYNTTEISSQSVQRNREGNLLSYEEAIYPNYYVTPLFKKMITMEDRSYGYNQELRIEELIPVEDIPVEDITDFDISETGDGTQNKKSQITATLELTRIVVESVLHPTGSSISITEDEPDSDEIELEQETGFVPPEEDVGVVPIRKIDYEYKTYVYLLPVIIGGESPYTFEWKFNSDVLDTNNLYSEKGLLAELPGLYNLKIFDNTGIVIEVEKTVTKTDYIDPDDIPESDFSNSKTIIVKESDFSDVKTVDEPDIVSPEVDSSGTDDNVKYNDEV